jgi:hypothetical protein
MPDGSTRLMCPAAGASTPLPRMNTGYPPVRACVAAPAADVCVISFLSRLGNDAELKNFIYICKK